MFRYRFMPSGFAPPFPASTLWARPGPGLPWLSPLSPETPGKHQEMAVVLANGEHHWTLGIGV